MQVVGRRHGAHIITARQEFGHAVDQGRQGEQGRHNVEKGRVLATKECACHANCIRGPCHGHLQLKRPPGNITARQIAQGRTRAVKLLGDDILELGCDLVLKVDSAEGHRGCPVSDGPPNLGMLALEEIRQGRFALVLLHSFLPGGEKMTRPVPFLTEPPTPPPPPARPVCATRLFLVMVGRASKSAEAFYDEQRDFFRGIIECASCSCAHNGPSSSLYSGDNNDDDVLLTAETILCPTCARRLKSDHGPCEHCWMPLSHDGRCVTLNVHMTRR